MLVLSRKVGEAILIGDHIEVTVVRVTHNSVRLGIEAPRGYRIVRDELQEPLEDEAAGRESGENPVASLSLKARQAEGR
jgi:carbon storage regulator